MNKHIKQRIYYLVFLGVLLITGVYFMLQALNQNINLYLTPSQLQQQLTKLNTQRMIRVGGLVKLNSVHYGSNQIISFVVTDGYHDLPVRYQGLLPGLFKPGKGVVVEGHYKNNLFIADMVLAKHDENYAPPKVST